MPITFSADFDYKSLRHVSVRSNKNREMELSPMPTAEEAARWINPELRFCSKASCWSPVYDDGVTERRDAEKARRDQSARKRLAVNPITLLEELSAIKVRPERPSTSEQRVIAEIVRAAPQELHWSGNLYTMTAAKLLDIASRCREALDPVFAWNLNVKLHEPRVPSPTRFAPRTCWNESDRDSKHNMRTLGFVSKSSQNAMVTEWMRAAEENRLPGRSTRCVLTGKSLVIKTSYFGRRSWQLAPTFQGMSVEAAQQVASAAAIQAGLVRGMVRGTPPPLVDHLRHNAQDWLGLVIATRHPVFYAMAAQLVNMGAETLRFGDDVNSNRAEWERLTMTSPVDNDVSDHCE